MIGCAVVLPRIKIDRVWLIEAVGGVIVPVDSPASHPDGYDPLTCAPHRFASFERLKAKIEDVRSKGATVFLYTACMMPFHQEGKETRWELWVRMAFKIPKVSNLTFS